MKPDKELRDLVDRLLANGLRKPEMARLEERLEQEPDAMRYYLETMEVEANLSEALNSLEEEPPIATQPSWWQRPANWALAAAATIAAFFLIKTNLITEEPHPNVRVTESVGVISGTNEDSYTVGTVIERKPVVIESGLLELTYGLGARVILQAPAKFEVTGRNSARLHYGKLVAEVPDSAKYFTVTYPDGRLIDLGTEFGMNVPREGASEVCVFRGEVEVIPGKADHGKHVRVLSDHAVRMAPKEEMGLTSVPFLRSQFVRDLPSHEMPWSLATLPDGATTMSWDVSDLVWSSGDYMAVFKWMNGRDSLQIESVRLRRANQQSPVSEDLHTGITGPDDETNGEGAPTAHRNVYHLNVEDYQRDRWTLEATFSNLSPTSLDTEGILIFQGVSSPPSDVSNFLGEWDYHHNGLVYRRVFLTNGECTLEINGQESHYFDDGHYTVEGGILRLHFDRYEWVEEHMLRGRDHLLFLNRPYRDARRKQR